MENEDQELKTTSNQTELRSMQNALKRIKTTLPKRGALNGKTSGKSLTTTGEDERDRLQLKLTGSQLGVTGSGQLSNGAVITKTIEMAKHGLPLMPQLKERNWRSIDMEISTEKTHVPTIFKITLEAEKTWMPILIQASAATRPSPYADVVLRLARLKTIKPTQNMEEQQASVFFEELATMLIDEGYCYTAIDEGIKKLMKREKNDFFPRPEVLIKYIYPINFVMNRRVDKLSEMLSRCHNEKD